ncbi:MAG: 4Fe-4S dicluster domain-containing protein [Candidatus Omnitrophota bacterium]|jgi:NAD-dependent dihydropyrimidine dehydrogenase PreA subunit
MSAIVTIDEKLCIGCAKCVKLCPAKILFIDIKSKKCKVKDDFRCDRRGGCEKVCPVKAIKIA